MLSPFSIPKWVRDCQVSFDPDTEAGSRRIEEIRARMAKFRDPDPEVTVVIPAYNEERDLLSTLDSLSRQQTRYRTLLLVVNNNSSDRTQEILDQCGVSSLFEPRQGISYTRQTGLENARGTYYLSADADSLYPPGWIDAHVAVLQDQTVSCSYGSHAFLPEGEDSRVWLAVYEKIAQWFFKFRGMRSREYLNVLGFNFAIRRQDGLNVGGFNINRQRWQDGWMAMQMMQLGKLKKVESDQGTVWTSSRRLQADGNLFQAFVKRMSIHSSKLVKYRAPTKNQVSS
ncbi:MAG: glycosyltransferase [Bacteroidetes bacterium]|nr:glycosyltransferase [Bacteroidota bacterium]